MLKRTEVKPFRGLRYNADKISSLSDVITPPYDVITSAAQAAYHEKDPFSSIRLDFGLGSEDENDENNRYTRATAVLEEWLQKGVLVADNKPSYYWIREEYRTPEGTEAVRDGFFAAMGLVDFSEGAVLPHEHTSSGPKTDRLALMRKTEANLSPIFCLYSDPDHELDRLLQDRLAKDADATASDEAGTRHSLWVIDDAELVAAIEEQMVGQTLMIADGHHRYETALAYRDERRRIDGSEKPQNYDYIMAYLSNSENPAMTIFPLHRLISGLTQETVATLPVLLAATFELEELAAGEGIDELLERMASCSNTRNTFGVHIAGRDAYYLLVARQPRPIIEAGPEHYSSAYRSLDVAVLDQVILAEILDIRPGGNNKDATVHYVERAEMNPEEIARADHQVMVLLNPTTMDEVKAVSDSGEKMPRKSTYFYPKPVTGLVFRSFLY